MKITWIKGKTVKETHYRGKDKARIARELKK